MWLRHTQDIDSLLPIGNPNMHNCFASEEMELYLIMLSLQSSFVFSLIKCCSNIKIHFQISKGQKPNHLCEKQHTYNPSHARCHVITSVNEKRIKDVHTNNWTFATQVEHLRGFWRFRRRDMSNVTSSNNGRSTTAYQEERRRLWKDTKKDNA